MITEPKIKLAPTSGRFLSKFLQTFRTMSGTCPEFRSDWPLLTLSNRCLIVWPMAAMFFEICKFLRTLFLLGQRYCIPNFKLIGPRFMRYSFHNLIAPPSGESGQFFYLTKKMSYTCVLSLVKISLPFKSYSYLSEIGPASFELLRPFSKVSWNFNFFSIIIIFTCREHFCSGLVPIGRKT